MVDLSSLSNEQLLTLRESMSGTSDSPTTPGVKRITVDTGAIGKTSDLSSLSNEELLALRDKMSPMNRVAETAKGIGRAMDAGVARGVAGIGGAVGDVMDAVGSLMSAGRNAYERHTGQPESPLLDRSQTIFGAIPTSAELRKEIERQFYDGQPLHDPQGKVEEYAQTIGEFAPNAVGGVGRRLVQRAGQVLLPAVASETAGQVTKGSSVEPWARFVGAIGGGGASLLLNRPGTTAAAIKAQLPEGVTPQMVDQAEALMMQARQQGIDLAWPEALSQVAQRPVLTNVMRHLEASPQTEARMAEFFGQRPQQVEQASRSQFDNIAPVNRNPSTIGREVGRAAEEEVNFTRKAINDASEPFYRQAEATLLTPQEMFQVRAVPGFAEAAKAVRSDPQLNRYVKYLPDNSVGFLNEVKKYLDTAKENASSAVNAQRNMQRSAGYGSDATRIRNIARTVDDQRGRGDYATALEIQERGRREVLQPLLDGYVGRLAKQDQTTRQAIDALFPKNPLPNSEHEIGQAVQALTRRNPKAATDLVRAHVESVFNEAAKDLQTGANQAGGAKFRTQLVGNAQQRLNLREAVEALPNGAERWKGFNNFLDVLEATGTRQGIGSRTTYNEQYSKNIGVGGVVADTLKTGANPARFGQKFIDRYERYKVGRDLGQLANILTDPRSGNLLREIARTTPGSEKARLLAFRLISYAEASRAAPVEKTGK
jgi:hypothetical protein